MENNRSIILSFVVTILFIPVSVYAYEPETTHRALTKEAISVFENYNKDKIFSDEEKEAIKLGSEEEDTYFIFRWMHHFYDPVHEDGLMGFSSSKIWSADTQGQALTNPIYTALLGNAVQSYFSSDTDFSWDRAIYEYVHGDKSRGLQSLGHVLHLIEDATVPDHTRLDPHMSDFDKTLGQASVYEEYTKQFTENNIDFAKGLIKNNEKPITHSSLGEYFYDLASFSNGNFFSRNTILDKNYVNPVIRKEIKEYLSNGVLYTFGLSESGFKLALIERNRDTKTGIINTKYFLSDLNDLIMSSYWSALAPKAITGAAGVIKLFFDEVEKEKETLALQKKNDSWMKAIARKIGNAITSVASVFSSGSSASENNASSNGASVAGAFENQDNSENNQNPQSEIDEPLQLENPEIQNEENLQEEEEIPEIYYLEEKLAEEEYYRTLNRKSEIQDQETSALFAVVPGFGGGGNSAPVQSVQLDQPKQPVEENKKTEIENATTSVEKIIPEISATISECQNSLASSVCLIATTTATLKIVPSASTTPVYFVLENNGEISTTTATETALSLKDFSENTINVSVTDIYGTSSATSTLTIESASIPVAINEIAWAGTDSNFADEWIELKNNTSQSINLDDWTLSAKSEKPYIKLSGVISPKGYFLLERTDDETISDISADIFFKGSISNEGEIFTLYNASTTMDKTTLSFDEKWPGGNNDGRISMERYSPRKSGTDEFNWGSNTESIYNGKDSLGNDVYGTPKARNSLNYFLNKNEDINEDLTLIKEESPYLVEDVNINLAEGKKLTIEAGVVIKFSGFSGMSFDGVLNSPGTEAEPVVFTSVGDDSFGGDFENNGQAEIISKWDGLNFFSGASGSKMNNMKVFHSDCGLSFYGVSAVQANDFEVSFSNYPVSLQNTIFSVNNGTFNSNTGQIITIYSESGLSASGIKIENSKNGYDSVVIYGGSNVNISDSFIKNTDGGGISVFGKSTVFLDDVMIDSINGDGVAVFDESKMSVSSTTVKNISNNSGAIIYGASEVSANGLNFENIGGEAGLIAFGMSSTTFVNSLFNNAGYSSAVYSFGVESENTILNISNSKILNNQNGVNVSFNSDIKIHSSEISGNKIGINLSGGTVEIKNSKIFGNIEAGIKNESDLPILTEWNFWGSESGPFHEILNPEGLGDKIFGEAVFSSWFIDEQMMESATTTGDII